MKIPIFWCMPIWLPVLEAPMGFKPRAFNILIITQWLHLFEVVIYTIVLSTAKLVVAQYFATPLQGCSE